MLVKYKAVGSVSNYALLFDESQGDANERFAPSFKDTVMKVTGYGAANVTKVALANTDGQVSFRFSKNYASLAAALAAIAALRATFKGVPVHLQITEGATVLYLPNAKLSASSHDQTGREVMHSMTFETDDVTSTAP